MTTGTPRSHNGFTVVEVLISAVIFLVIMMAMYQLFTSSQANYAGGTRKANVQQNARLAMEEMVRDLRMAGYRPEDGTSNAQPVRVGTPTGIAVIGAWGTEGASNIRVYCYEAEHVEAGVTVPGQLRRRENLDSTRTWTPTRSTVTYRVRPSQTGTRCARLW
jgi:prepilin-type N-terminal cleavage/methylation domain-containing protein